MSSDRPPGTRESIRTSDDLQIEVWRHGDRHPDSRHPPVLLVHGLGSSSIDWNRSVTDLVADGREVITLDLVGHGGSDKQRRPLRIRDHAGDLVSVLDQLKLEQVDVVGISLGGKIALELTAIVPTRIRRLVVACCALDTRRHRPRVLAQWVTRSAVLHGLGLRASTRVLSRALFPKPEHEQLRSDFELQWLRNDLSAYRAALQGAFGWHARGRLAQFAGEALVLGADRDFVPESELDAIARELSRGSGTATVSMVEDCGHAIPAERPDEWSKQLVRFLGRD